MTEMNQAVETTSKDEGLAWDLALHEERVLNERSGLFLVAQAMLLVFYATIHARVSVELLMVFAGVGLLISILWSILGKRQSVDLAAAKQALKDASPFYKRYLEGRQQGSFRNWDSPVLVYGLPFLVAIVWLALLWHNFGAPAS
jgi:hypothetical protein